MLRSLFCMAVLTFPSHISMTTFAAFVGNERNVNTPLPSETVGGRLAPDWTDGSGC